MGWIYHSVPNLSYCALGLIVILGWVIIQGWICHSEKKLWWICHSDPNLSFWVEFAILAWILKSQFHANLSSLFILKTLRHHRLLKKKEKKSSSFYNDRERILQRTKKCLVVKFEKEPECSTQENLLTTRSLNQRK